MDTQNLARWIDELQAQIADLRIKVYAPVPEPVDKDVTPFVDLTKVTAVTLEDDATFQATYDCYIHVVNGTLYLSTDGTTVGLYMGTSGYVKKGQYIMIVTNVGATCTYNMTALYGGEQPPAPDPTPDVAPAADTRSTKKKK